MHSLCCMQHDARMPNSAGNRWGGGGSEPRTLPTFEQAVPRGLQPLLSGDQVVALGDQLMPHCLGKLLVSCCAHRISRLLDLALLGLDLGPPAAQGGGKPSRKLEAENKSIADAGQRS